jgi:hypothetical protein
MFFFLIQLLTYMDINLKLHTMTEEELYYFNYVIDMIEESELQLLETQSCLHYYDNDDDLPW